MDRLERVSDVPEPEFVQPRTAVDGPIALVEADPAWAEQYARAATRIQAALGARVQGIEHVGSTSVPGLAAKPIIDIVLAVADSADEDDYVPLLVAADYVLHVREPGWHEHRLLKGRDPLTNLHVFTLGSPEVERMIQFRDRLRTDRGELELYESRKRELASGHWAHVQDYADAKSSVVEEIIARAPR